MPAPKGHPRWGNPLNPKKYSPEKLWEKALEYFDWVDKNPWNIKEQVKQKVTIPKNNNLSSEEIKEILDPIIDIPTQRPYTLLGFCIFADISHDTFQNYENAKENEGTTKEQAETFVGVCKRIREIIDGTMLEGGLVGAFEKGLVARKLGLTEKKELTGKDGEPLQSGNIIINFTEVANEDETSEKTT